MHREKKITTGEFIKKKYDYSGSTRGGMPGVYKWGGYRNEGLLTKKRVDYIDPSPQRRKARRNGGQGQPFPSVKRSVNPKGAGSGGRLNGSSSIVEKV